MRSHKDALRRNEALIGKKLTIVHFELGYRVGIYKLIYIDVFAVLSEVT